MATVTATASTVENPKNPTDLNSAPPSAEDALSTQSPPSSDAGGDDSKEKPVVVAANTGDVEAGEVATDIQKKMKRAERFGMPVNLTEVEKRNSRAERFGTAPVATVTNSSKQADELKRKARAERFGIVQSVSADEEVKKKARLARFGASPVPNTIEEEKKKSRALRFSQPESGSQGNGKANVEVKAIAGKDDAGT